MGGAKGINRVQSPKLRSFTEQAAVGKTQTTDIAQKEKGK